MKRDPLVIVAGPRSQVLCLHLHGVIDITRGVCCPAALNLFEIRCSCYFVLNTHRSRAHLLRPVTIQWSISADGRVARDIVYHRRDPRPQNHRVWIWVSRGDSMGEVQLFGSETLFRSAQVSECQAELLPEGYAYVFRLLTLWSETPRPG